MGVLLRRQVGLAGSCSHWLLPCSEQKGGFGGASAHRMAELAESGGRVLGLRLRCGGADEGGGGGECCGWQMEVCRNESRPFGTLTSALGVF